VEEGIIVPPSNHAEVGVTGSKSEGIGAEGSISKDLGKGKVLEAEGKISQKKGWSFKALFGWSWK
jgi:hypothetical protein